MIRAEDILEQLCHILQLEAYTPGIVVVGEDVGKRIKKKGAQRSDSGGIAFVVSEIDSLRAVR